jgi:hypothetical protein
MPTTPQLSRLELEALRREAVRRLPRNQHIGRVDPSVHEEGFFQIMGAINALPMPNIWTEADLNRYMPYR